MSINLTPFEVAITSLWHSFIALQIGDLLSVFLGGVLGFLLVVFVEWIKSPSIKIEIAESIIVPGSPKRKLTKIRVTVKKDWRCFLPIPKNIHAFSKVKVKLGWKTKPEYQAKWDNAPEPWDYIKRVPKLEMSPLAMQPENLMPGDVAEAGIAAKHEGLPGFFLFDADYYIPNVAVTKNLCRKKEVLLEVTLKSSLGEWKEHFILRNPNKKLDNFTLEKLRKK